MRKTAALLLLLCASIGHTDDDLTVKYGANVSSDAEKMGRTKAIFIADQSSFKYLPFLLQQYEVGSWFDNSGIQGRRSSLMGGYSLGVNVNAGSMYAQALVGPALISSPDSNLGGNLQFNNDISIGLRDLRTEATIGLSYKHISSAGIAEPNRGRDFFMFRVGIPW